MYNWDGFTKILLVTPEGQKHGFDNDIKPVHVNHRLIPAVLYRPNLTVLALAALTPEKHSVEIVDDSFDPINFNNNYDIVGITVITPDAIRAYEIADEFKRRGKTVVLGGYHPSVLPEEAKQHADSVVIGEAEDLWGKLLDDYSQGKMKPFYKQSKQVELSDVPSLRNVRGLLKHRTFPEAIEASRGCPMGCKFCCHTNKPYYREFRKRNVEDVIEDISSLSKRFFVFIDNNFAFDPNFTKQLLREMKTLNKKFLALANISSFENDEELLKLAAEAGLIQINLGLESPSQEGINSIGKTKNQVKKYAEIIKKIHDYNIMVLGYFIFGLETDNTDIFNQTLDFIKDIDLDAANMMILTPYPGTPLFEQFNTEGRILTKNWSKYDMDHVVFKPKNMTPEELEEGMRQIVKEYYSSINVLKRIVKSTKYGYFSFLSMSSLSYATYKWAKLFCSTTS